MGTHGLRGTQFGRSRPVLCKINAQPTVTCSLGLVRRSCFYRPDRSADACGGDGTLHAAGTSVTYSPYLPPGGRTCTSLSWEGLRGRQAAVLAFPGHVAHQGKVSSALFQQTLRCSRLMKKREREEELLKQFYLNCIQSIYDKDLF